jgi:hypothetical protein
MIQLDQSKSTASTSRVAWPAPSFLTQPSEQPSVYASDVRTVRSSFDETHKQKHPMTLAPIEARRKHRQGEALPSLRRLGFYDLTPEHQGIVPPTPNDDILSPSLPLRLNPRIVFDGVFR